MSLTLVRPTAISFDKLKNPAKQHPCEGVRYFAANPGCSLSTVSNGLRSLGMVKELEAADSTGWTPLSLEMKNGSSTSTTPVVDVEDPIKANFRDCACLERERRHC
ncbi:hypothetical protein RB195_006828 [Necator americanus]|uniref:Uncharacterized protein n=1 Tax=Necator americanus TaxID=51031 RepID=A0ABR1BUG6_NECAM